MKNSGDRAWPVGQLKPNDFGLFDMLGNAFERRQDPGVRPAAYGSVVIDAESLTAIPQLRRLRLPARRGVLLHRVQPTIRGPALEPGVGTAQHRRSARGKDVAVRGG